MNLFLVQQISTQYDIYFPSEYDNEYETKENKKFTKLVWKKLNQK